MKNKFVNTRNVQEFVDTAEALQSKDAGVPGLALVHGARGLGKTRTAIWFSAKSDAVYLRAKSVWSPSWLLEELAVELGVTPRKRKKDLFTDVENSLKERPRLVVIDEANIPPLACIECIRDIHDVTDAPFLIIGHEGIVQRLRRLGPFFDRFLYVTEFKPLDKKDLMEFCRASMDIDVHENVLERVLARTTGNFRKSIVALKGLENRAKLNGSKHIGLEHFDKN